MRVGNNFSCFFILILLCISSVAGAVVEHAGSTNEVVWYETDKNEQPLIHLYFFWSKKCPHCLKAQPDILEMAKAYPWIKLHSLELVDKPENVQTYINMATLLGNYANSVPAFMFCGNMLTGYESTKTSGQLLEYYLKQCYQFARDNNPDNATTFVLDSGGPASLEVPFLGKVSVNDYSLPVLTVFIAGMDAFNPCAFFVLLFLLSMMVHSRSRARMALIGGIFVFFSGLLYFLFMAAWMNLFIYLGELSLLTILAGCVAVFIALINIKDYFWFRKGLSLGISENKKPVLFERVRRLLRLDSITTVIFATITLAIVANSYELLCTAGFPMVYTRILTLESLPEQQYYFYLLLYNLIYILPLLVIVIVFTVKLGSRKLSEQEGMVLKLLSGVMMLMLGLFLLLAPQILNSLAAAAVILMAAIFITMGIVKVTSKKAET